MPKTTGRILKSSDVKLEGRVRIEAATGNPGPATGERNAASAAAQVSIVENNPEFALIEITCGCGTKTQVRCEYADAQSAEQAAGQNNGENENES